MSVSVIIKFSAGTVYNEEDKAVFDAFYKHFRHNYAILLFLKGIWFGFIPTKLRGWKNKNKMEGLSPIVLFYLPWNGCKFEDIVGY